MVAVSAAALNEVYLVDGTDVCGGTSVDVHTDARAVITGVNNYFGNEVAYLDDVDGDGLDDLAIGAPTDDTAGTNHGAVFLFLDSPSGNVDAADADVIVLGSENNGYLMKVTQASDDVQGPGHPYLLFGQQADTHGHLGVVRVDPSDLTGKSSVGLLAVADGGVSTFSTDRIMSAVNLGDMGTDGADELVIGAWTPGIISVRNLTGTVSDQDLSIEITTPADAWYTGVTAIGDRRYRRGSARGHARPRGGLARRRRARSQLHPPCR